MKEVFPIIAPSNGAFWFFGGLALLMLAVAAGFLWAFLSIRSMQVEVSEQGMRLSGDFYGRLIPWSKLRLNEARVVDLANEPNLMPTRRTLGTGLPGYQAGWFRLKNGEKGLLYLTDKSRVA